MSFEKQQRGKSDYQGGNSRRSPRFVGIANSQEHQTQCDNDECDDVCFHGSRLKGALPRSRFTTLLSQSSAASSERVTIPPHRSHLPVATHRTHLLLRVLLYLPRRKVNGSGPTKRRKGSGSSRQDRRGHTSKGYGVSACWKGVTEAEELWNTGSVSSAGRGCVGCARGSSRQVL